jgi:hypothetical protein
MVPNFSTITLYIPNGCTDAYRSAKEWKNFTNIVEKIPNGIMSPSSSSTTQHVFYDLQGRLVQGMPKKGVYIQGGKKHVVR